MAFNVLLCRVLRYADADSTVAVSGRNGEICVPTFLPSFDQSLSNSVFLRLDPLPVIRLRGEASSFGMRQLLIESYLLFASLLLLGSREN